MTTISNPNRRNSRVGLNWVNIIALINAVLLFAWVYSVLIDEDNVGSGVALLSSSEVSTTQSSSSLTNNNNALSNVNWCDKVSQARANLLPELRVTVPCETMKPAKSAVVCYLTAGVPDGKGNHKVFTGTDYINGALALGAALSDHLTRQDTHMLLLIREGFSIPPQQAENLQAVGWTIGKAPKIDVARQYMPRFERYKTLYTKISVIDLAEYDCVLLLDADALVIGNIDDLMSCQILQSKVNPNKKYRVAGTLDWYHGKWYHFNTGSALWRPDSTEMNRVFNLTRDPKFMRRFESDQIFSNTVYPDRTNVTMNELLIKGGKNLEDESSWGQVAHMDWQYNAQTHVENQRPEYWEPNLPNVKILHFTHFKGWQCPERHGGPPVPKKTMPRRPERCREVPGCACNEAYRWYDYLAKAKSLGTNSSTTSLTFGKSN